VGSDEPRSANNAQTKVAGKRTAVDIVITLLRPSDQSMRSVLADIPARVSATTLGTLPTWAISLLVVIACLSALVLPIGALVWADRIDGKQR
jgi:hypothetical protein